MYDYEHLLVLRTRDAAGWNKWRAQHGSIRPNLSGADLRDYILTGANCRGVDLRGANLINADLRGADLTGANLCWTNLRGADLTGADLSHATLFATVFGSTGLT